MNAIYTTDCSELLVTYNIGIIIGKNEYKYMHIKGIYWLRNYKRQNIRNTYSYNTDNVNWRWVEESVTMHTSRYPSYRANHAVEIGIDNRPKGLFYPIRCCLLGNLYVG